MFAQMKISKKLPALIGDDRHHICRHYGHDLLQHCSQ